MPSATALSRAAPRDAARAETGPPMPAAPGEALGILINRVAKAWREELDRRLRPLGLTRVQWQALLLIARSEGALTQREIGEHLDIGAPATVALIDRMERDGLVERAAGAGRPTPQRGAHHAFQPAPADAHRGRGRDAAPRDPGRADATGGRDAARAADQGPRAHRGAERGRRDEHLPALRRPRLRVLVIGAAVAARPRAGAWWWLQRGQQRLDRQRVRQRPRRSGVVTRDGPGGRRPDPRERARAQGRRAVRARPASVRGGAGRSRGQLRQAEQGTRADTSEVAASAADVARLNADLGNAETACGDRSSSCSRASCRSRRSTTHRRASTPRAPRSTRVRRAWRRRVPRPPPRRAVTPAVLVAQRGSRQGATRPRARRHRAPGRRHRTHFDLAAGTVVTPGNPLFAHRGGTLVLGRRQFQGDRARRRASRPAGDDRGRHVSRPRFHGHVESLAGGTRRRVLAAAAAERQRQLGEGGAARAGAKVTRRRSRSAHFRCASAPPRRSTSHCARSRRIGGLAAMSDAPLARRRRIARDDHARGDVRDADPGARHHDRQRRAAAHGGRAVGARPTRSAGCSRATSCRRRS